MDSPKIDPVCVQVEVCCLFGFVVLIQTPDVTISGTELHIWGCFPSGDYNLKNRVMSVITASRSGQTGFTRSFRWSTCSLTNRQSNFVGLIPWPWAIDYTLIIRKTNEVSLVASFFFFRAGEERQFRNIPQHFESRDACGNWSKEWPSTLTKRTKRGKNVVSKSCWVC